MVRYMNLKLEEEQYKYMAMAKLDYEMDKEHSITWERFIKVVFDAYNGI